MTCANMQEARKRYGKLMRTREGKLLWPSESEWMEKLKVPEFVARHVINSATGQPWAWVYCNKDIHRPLIGVMELLHFRGLLKEWQTFDGCFNLRDIRGTTDNPSTHCYGLAIDINAQENLLGQEPTLSKEFVNCWRELKWIWGGEFSRKDGMHFQFIGI